MVAILLNQTIKLVTVHNENVLLFLRVDTFLTRLLMTIQNYLFAI